MVQHEALLALLGHTGGLIRQHKDSFKVANHVSFLVDYEKELLERVSGLGFTYLQLNKFVQKVQNAGANEAEIGLRDGLYLKALCSGIDEILAVYRSMVLSLEQAVLEDPTLSLNFFSTKTTEFVPISVYIDLNSRSSDNCQLAVEICCRQPDGHCLMTPQELLLPALLRLAREVEEKKVHGCCLLDTIAAHSCNGVPIVQACMGRILARVNLVLYSQVSAWVMYGMLSDIHDEFFIYSCTPQAGDRRHQKEEASVGEQKPQTGSRREKLWLQGASYAEEHSYALYLPMKPACLSAPLLEKVRFCGVAMRVMLHPNAQEDDRPEPPVIARLSERLQELAREPALHRASFEAWVDDVHAYLAKRLRRLVVERARLQVHLKAVKDYFLLARGDLFQAFIDNTRGMLTLAPTDTAEHDVNEPFRKAGLQSYADEEEAFGRTQLMVGAASEGDKGGEGGGGEEDGMDRLRMWYDMEWPLGTLLFTPEVMRTYNALFAFLLRVKRAASELQHAWHETQSGRYGRAMSSTLHKGTESGKHMTGMWTLRAEMAFLVNNLLYYLQCDVLDSQYETVKQAIRTCDSFETIRSAHARFLDRISSECLMKNKLAWQTVNTILKISLKFGRRMTLWQEVDKGAIEEAFPPSMRKFRISESAAAVHGAYVGFPMIVSGEVAVVTDYTSDRVATVYKPLKVASAAGDTDGMAEDLVGCRYCVQAPAITPDELAEVRQRFQRNALLLFTVLKTSQTHTTPVLSQLLLRMDYNRFFEQQQTTWQTQAMGRR